MLTQSELKKLLSYDPETGDFTWLAGRKLAGKKAGADSNGYLQTEINGKRYLAHRLAWLYVYGVMPSRDIDHIDRVRNNNRIDNLRECSNMENHWNVDMRINNKSGFKGVSWFKRDEKWLAQIKINGKQKNLGLFATAELASAAYQAKARELHGEFYRNTN